MWNTHIFARRTMDQVEQLFCLQYKVIIDYQNTKLFKVHLDLVCGWERPLDVTGKLRKNFPEIIPILTTNNFKLESYLNVSSMLHLHFEV